MDLSHQRDLEDSVVKVSSREGGVDLSRSQELLAQPLPSVSSREGGVDLSMKRATKRDIIRRLLP